MNKREIGTTYENLATKYLESNNIKILEKNFRCRFGEIDIIGMEKDTLVFFEIKYRTSNTTGYPEEAVHTRKQRTICKVADYYRMKKSISMFQPMRYDVIAIFLEEIKWYQNAFFHIGTSM